MIGRLRTRLRALAGAVVVELLPLLKLAGCVAWAWLLWGGVAFALEGRAQAAALCWAGFCGAIAFVVLRPRPTPAALTKDQAMALLQQLVQAAREGA